MLRALSLILFFTLCGCSKVFDSSFPHFEFSPSLEDKDLVLQYDKWSVSQKEFFEHFPEFRAFHEEFSAVQTAVALQDLIKKIGSDTEIQITGCSREAGLMTLNRLGVAIQDKKLVFKDAQGKSTISANGKTYNVLELPLNHLELASMQTHYYLRGQSAAEELLVQKILSEKERTTLSSGLVVTNQEVKKQIAKLQVNPHAIGLHGVNKIRDSLLSHKQKAAFKEYVGKYIYKSPVLSRWKKPSYQFDSLPDRAFAKGNGSMQMIVFSPYDCRTCLAWNQELPQFMTPEIGIKYYPAVSDDTRTSSLAFYEGVLCLTEQRRDIIWDMLPKFKSVSYRSKLNERIVEYIKDEKLDENRYAECLQKKKYLTQLERYQKFSQKLESRSFPIVLAGGFVFTGAINADEVRDAITAQKAHSLHKWSSSVDGYLKKKK